jgi:hypothetical protein
MRLRYKCVGGSMSIIQANLAFQKVLDENPHVNRWGAMNKVEEIREVAKCSLPEAIAMVIRRILEGGETFQDPISKVN